MYLNEFDAFNAQWLRNLYPQADVDARSIADVPSTALYGVERAHFFAGIGVWEYALQLAGWPKRRQVWTGSCPCQPFSAIGKQEGEQDERHLWPEWRRIIRDNHPAVLFGEQVASPLGRVWLAGVRADLEALGYEVGAADLCAAGVGAPHIRQRLFWVAYAKQPGLEGYDRDGHDGHESRWQHAIQIGSTAAGGVALPWSHATWWTGADGKKRRIGPGVFPLAHGAAARVGRLHAYGNAIVAYLAAEFVSAFLEAESELAQPQAVAA